MKLKFDCKVYNKKGEDFTIIPKDTEINILEVTNRTVKIKWTFKDKIYDGYLAHRQFMICVDKY